MIVVIAHAENTITWIQNIEIYMVHPNVGVRPPSRGIDFLHGDYNSFTHALTTSTGIHENYINVH